MGNYHHARLAPRLDAVQDFNDRVHEKVLKPISERSPAPECPTTASSPGSTSY